jgi:peptide/nickel transport system permease protein
MLKYTTRRLGLAIFVMIGVIAATFIIGNIVPGDPARLAAGPHAGPEQVAKLRHEYGLDQPLPVQFVRYVTRLVHGDLGRSITSYRPVARDIAEYLPATIELALWAALLTVIMGIPLGVLSAVRRNGAVDLSSRLVALLGVTMPAFWLGLILQVVFFRGLGWLPAGGRIDAFITLPPRLTGFIVFDSVLAGNWAAAASALQHLILPAVTLAFGSVSVVTRMTRATMLEVLREDYVRTARAKGLAARVVIYKHALRNAMVPIITVVGLQVGYLLSGVFYVESIFGYPGLGTYTIRAITSLDFSGILGSTIVVALVYLVINLIADLSYPLFDPRINVQ